MSFLRTLVVAVAAVALGAYIYFVERPKMATEDAEDVLVELQPADVQTLRLSYPDEEPIVLRREADDWRLAEPIDADADDTTVDRLVEQIADAKAERRISAEEAQGLEIYGLAGDGERARVSIALADGTELPDIIVGGTTPVGFNAFARLDGAPEIVVTPLILHTGIKKTVFELRDKKLFDIDRDEVSAVRVDTPGLSVRIDRADAGWKLEGLEEKADDNRVQTLISSLANLQALAFYDRDPLTRAEAGLADPALTVELEVGEGTTMGFRLGDENADAPAGYYIERIPDGLLAKVPEWVASRFRVDLADLRDKHLFDCDPNEIVKMTFERADGQGFALFERDDGTWAMEPAAEGELRRAVITRRRNGLATLAATEIAADQVDSPAELARYGLDEPAVEVELELGSGESCGRALGGTVAGEEADDRAHYVMRVGDDTVMRMPQYLYSRLDALRSDFVKPAP